MAYCQAQLYARYMLKRFGADALIKMLDAYRRGLTTDRAIDDCFHVEKADFEKGYLAYPRRGGQDDPHPRRARRSRSSSRSSSGQLKAKPDDPDLNARMAYEHFARRDYKEARPVRRQGARSSSRTTRWPATSRPGCCSRSATSDAALAVLEPALDPKKPNERVIDLLAELEMKAGQLDEAERLYELARKDDPFHTKWIAGLARVHLRQKQTDKFLDRPGDDRRQRRRRPRRAQGPGRAPPGRRRRRRRPRNGPTSACISTSTTRPSTSSWPTPCPPARSTPRPSRNTRPRSSSRPRSRTT